MYISQELASSIKTWNTSQLVIVTIITRENMSFGIPPTFHCSKTLKIDLLGFTNDVSLSSLLTTINLETCLLIMLLDALFSLWMSHVDPMYGHIPLSFLFLCFSYCLSFPLLGPQVLWFSWGMASSFKGDYLCLNDSSRLQDIFLFRLFSISFSWMYSDIRPFLINFFTTSLGWNQSFVL